MQPPESVIREHVREHIKTSSMCTLNSMNASPRNKDIIYSSLTYSHGSHVQACCCWSDVLVLLDHSLVQCSLWDGNEEASDVWGLEWNETHAYIFANALCFWGASASVSGMSYTDKTLRVEMLASCCCSMFSEAACISVGVRRVVVCHQRRWLMKKTEQIVHLCSFGEITDLVYPGSLPVDISLLTHCLVRPYSQAETVIS